MSTKNLSARMILVLTVIAMLSGGILAAWDSYTEPRIAYHQLQALKAAIQEVLPPYDRYEPINTTDMELYVAYAAGSDSIVGIAFEAVGSGFQGELRVMVGVKPDFSTLTGIKVLAQIETPGLGTKIVEDPSNKEDPFWFPRQFQGVHLNPAITVIKNALPSHPNEVQGITGATISSKAIVRILNDDILRAKTIYQSGKD